jgi:hypothetical protein
MMCFIFKSIFYYVSILAYTIVAVLTPNDNRSFILL